MRKILIISVGESPAVVTETVWKLFQREPPWVPDAIHISTTARGRETFEKRGLTGPDGKLAELYQEFGHKPVAAQVDVPVDENNNQISDIRTETENILYGNQITRLVKSYADDPDTQIHMSLAGGRKLQSWYAGDAIHLFGRPQDELSHVLVKSDHVAPHMIEFARDFWWPGQKTDPVHYLDRRTGEEVKVSIDGVDVDMSLIPFVRLYSTFGDKIMDLYPGGDIDLANVVEAVQDLLDAQQILLIRKTRTLVAGKHRIRLEHQDFAFYNLLALAKKEGWRGCGPEGVGGNHFGWISFAEMVEDGWLLKRFKEIYKELYDLEGADPEEAHRAVEAFIQQRILAEMGAEGKPQEARNTISQMRGGCKKIIDRILRKNIALAERLHIHDRRIGGKIDRIGLVMRAEDIEIVDE